MFVYIYVYIYDVVCILQASEVAQMVKNLSAMQEIQVQSLGREEANGNPFQYSCLENSMEGRAWQATVHGVAESDMTE